MMAHLMNDEGASAGTLTPGVSGYETGPLNDRPRRPILQLRFAQREADVIPFPAPAPRLRADVPPFDPTNADHLRAWESIVDLGRVEVASQREGR